MDSVRAYAETKKDKFVAVVPSDKHRETYVFKLKESFLKVDLFERFEDAMKDARKFLNEG